VRIIYYNFPNQTPNETNMKTQTSSNRILCRFLAAVGLALMSIISVRADYQSTVLGDHPLAFYPINATVDPTGTTATDLSGNGNKGTYNGTDPQFNTVPGPSSFIPDALMFDGGTSFVDLSTGTNTSILNFGGTITMEAWVQPASPMVGSSTPADILGKGYDGTNEMTLRANGGYYYGGTYNNNTGGGNANGGQETTNWTYLVSTYDGTNWNLYENTKLVGQGSDAVGAINFTAPWAIGDGTTSTAGGNSGNVRFFQGNLTEVAIYTNALTAAQVLNHFCVGELGTTSSNSIPIIVTQPQPQSAFVGGTVTFSVGVASALPTTNLWFKNGMALTGKTNSTLTLTNVGAADAVNYSVVVGNSNGTTNSVPASLTLLATGNSLKWNSAGTNGVWDTGTSADWLNLSNSTQTVFNTNDRVLFDDTVGVSNNVIINGTVSPSVITVNSSTNNFTFAQGTSPLISGPGSLNKQGSSTLTILAPANFTGPVSISGGTVYAGDYSFQSASAITVTTNGTLDFGGSTYTSGQTVTISGTGNTNEGALFNSIYNPGQLYNIVLAGDATIGCTPGNIWGLNGGSTVSGNHKLTIKWGGSGDYTEWNGVKFATNLGDIELANGKLGIKNMGSNFGNPASTVTVDAGTELDFWTPDFGSNGYAKNYHIFGTYQVLTSFTNLSSSYTLENGCQVTLAYASGNVPLTGTVTLNGVAHLLLGDANYVFSNAISGSGGFVWDAYNHQMILQSSNTYTGPTIIGGGQQVLALAGNGSILHSSLIFFGGGVNNSTNTTIDVSGRSDQTLTLASGQTLAGIGGINGSLVVAAGATLSPAGTNTTIGITTGANPTGTIAASANITLNGTTVIKLNGSGTNDMVQAAANITYGGTLNLINISGSPLAAGNSFKIFSAAVYSGSFASITPAKPGSGLAWNTNQLGSGIVSVVAQATPPVISSTRVSGGNLIFTGTGGTTNGTFYVLTSTNVATPLASWTPLSTNMFDGSGNFSVTNAIVPGVPHEFYLLKTP
jgi:fibronectin-binding autotransporter adhesin